MSVQCFRIFLGPLLPFLGHSLKVLQIKIAQCYRAVELSLQHSTRTREPLMMGELKIEAKQGMWRDTRTWISKGSLCHDRKLTFFLSMDTAVQDKRNETWGNISNPLHLERSWVGEGEDTPRRVCEHVTRAETSICPKTLVEDTELRWASKWPHPD